jgi:hypothetical protein
VNPVKRHARRSFFHPNTLVCVGVAKLASRHENFLGGLISKAGKALGSSLGSMAGQALGLELEGLSAEDREFERPAGPRRSASAGGPAIVPPESRNVSAGMCM